MLSGVSQNRQVSEGKTNILTTLSMRALPASTSTSRRHLVNLNFSLRVWAALVFFSCVKSAQKPNGTSAKVVAMESCCRACSRSDDFRRFSLYAVAEVSQEVIANMIRDTSDTQVRKTPPSSMRVWGVFLLSLNGGDATPKHISLWKSIQLGDFVIYFLDVKIWILITDYYNKLKRYIFLKFSISAIYFAKQSGKLTI